MREHSGAPDTAVGPECEEPAGTLNSASEAHSSVRGHSGETGTWLFLLSGPVMTETAMEKRITPSPVP